MEGPLAIVRSFFSIPALDAVFILCVLWFCTGCDSQPASVSSTLSAAVEPPSSPEIVTSQLQSPTIVRRESSSAVTGDPSNQFIPQGISASVGPSDMSRKVQAVADRLISAA